MSFDWREYLDLARHLVDQPKGFTREAGLRSATSRAYYAAFCTARNVAQQTWDFIPKRGPEDHGRLKRYFARLRMMGPARTLDEMRQWRNKCDYDDHVRDLESLARKAIEDAEDVLGALRR